MKQLVLVGLFSLVLASVGQRVHASPLTSLIASLDEGEWGELSTNISVSTLYSSDSVLSWSDSAAWDPVGKRIYAICKAPGGDPYRMIQYDEATNSWSHTDVSGRISSKYGHCYDGATFNQNNGTFYFAYYQSSEVLFYKPSTGAWGHLPSTGLPEQPTYGLAWFPGLGGSQNSLLISVGPDKLGYWNGSRWDSYTVSQGDFGSFGSFVEYNPVHDLALFGGTSTDAEESRDRVLYKMDNGGNVTRLGNSPVSITDRNTLVTVDPVSGQYIINNHVDNEWWSLDLSDGGERWTQLRFTNAPDYDSALQVPLAGYGAILFVGLIKNDAGSFVPSVFVYKHKASSALSEDPKPPVIVE